MALAGRLQAGDFMAQLQGVPKNIPKASERLVPGLKAQQQNGHVPGQELLGGSASAEKTTGRNVTVPTF